MRLGFVFALASAVFFAGCCSSKAPRARRVAKAPAPKAVHTVRTHAPRTHTVTARPVARTIDNSVAVRAVVPPPPPPISVDSTRPVRTVTPARRTPTLTTIRPASRPARVPTAIRGYAPPPAPAIDVPACNKPVYKPCDPCANGACAVPGMCVGGNCGIPQPFDLLSK